MENTRDINFFTKFFTNCWCGEWLLVNDLTNRYLNVYNTIPIKIDLPSITFIVISIWKIFFFNKIDNNFTIFLLKDIRGREDISWFLYLLYTTDLSQHVDPLVMWGPHVTKRQVAYIGNRRSFFLKRGGD